MSTRTFKSVDTLFLVLTIVLVGIGLISFVSASLGILARNEATFHNVLLSQFGLGIGCGIVALICMLRVRYQWLRSNAFYIFIAALVLMALVFVPHLGYAHGGARRWIGLGPVSFQPAEVLKIAFILYFAAWLAWLEKRKKSATHGIIPLVAMLVCTAGLLLLQPDTKSLILICVASAGMLVVSGVSLKHFFGIGGLILVGFALLVYVTPYLRDRVQTFIDPSHDPRGTSYQLQQSLIAFGNGGVTGTGLGQSVQKFNYLPEPQGDSIFAIIGEEFGFIGTIIVILLYVMWGARGFVIARRAPDTFSRLTVVGLVILVVFQSFLNIASLTGVFPLTGVPLVFMSQGGTSLAVSLALVGIILHISRFMKTT